MQKQSKMDGKKAVGFLRSLAIKHDVRLLDAFLLAGIHPSNLTLWTKGITRYPRHRNTEDIEAAIELLAEVNREAS